MRSKSYGHAVLIAAVALLLVAAAGTPATADKVLDDLLFDLQLVPLEGKAPAPFTLERLGDNQKVTLADHAGRAIFLYFWATW